MTDKELLARLQTGEGPLCEFKASAQSAEVREAVVAFANTVRAPDVAVLFLGIDPAGTPSGSISDPDKTQRDVVRHLSSCYPQIQGIQLHPLTISGRNVVAVETPESRNAPHFTGPAFRRVGSQNVKASPEMFDEMIADRTQACRLLRLWVGKNVRYQRGGTGYRSETVATTPLLAVDALGLTLYVSGANPVTATWESVQLHPIQSGQSPFIRILS